MKKIFDWVKSSNHYYHIGLLAALSLVMMSVGAFEFGRNALWTNVWQVSKFGILAGVLIEVYQAIVNKSVDIRNSLGDLLADAIGLVFGIGIYILLSCFSPFTAITLLCIAAMCVILAFAIDAHRNTLLMVFLLCLVLGFSLFVYA